MLPVSFVEFCEYTQKILGKELNVKPFKFHRYQELSENHKQQRLVFTALASAHWTTGSGVQWIG